MGSTVRPLAWAASTTRSKRCHSKFFGVSGWMLFQDRSTRTHFAPEFAASSRPMPRSLSDFQVRVSPYAMPIRSWRGWFAAVEVGEAEPWPAVAVGKIDGAAVGESVAMMVAPAEMTNATTATNNRCRLPESFAMAHSLGQACSKGHQRVCVRPPDRRVDAVRTVAAARC